MSDEVKFKVDGQWFYRGNRSPQWLALASRPDGSACGITDKVPAEMWSVLEELAKVTAELEETRDALSSEHDAHMECHRKAENLQKVVEPHETIDMLKQRVQVSDLRASLLEQVNIKLVGAIDMIRESLNGGNVQDLLFIINSTLSQAESAPAAGTEET